MKSKFLHLLNDELVKLVNLVMQSLKATKRQSDTTIFAESVKVSKFHETFAKSLKSLMSIFSSRGVMDVRLSLGQYRTNIQRISNLYLTPNRYFTRFAAVFALVFVMGVGNVWGTDYELTTTITDGEYVIGAVKGSAGTDTHIFAINNTDGSSWKAGTETTPSNGKISNPSAAIVWTLTTSGTNGFTLKNGTKYITVGTGTGSGSVRANSTTAGTIYYAPTGSNSTFEISGVSTFTVSSGNQVGYNIGSGYRQYAQRTHSTQTSSGQISVQFRFYKKASNCNPLTMSTVTATPGNAQIALSWPAVANASSYTVTCKVKSSGASAGTVGSVTGTTTKSCTITGLANGTEYTWSVMPVGTGSYCAENTPATGDATPNVSRTITYYDKDGQHSTSLTDGTNIATALNALYGVGGPTSCNTTDYNYFVGWKDGEISGSATSVTLLSTEVVNATTAAKSYYAVWSDTDPSAAGGWEVATSITVGDVVMLGYNASKQLSGISTTSTKYGLVANFPSGDADAAYPLTVCAGSSNGTFAFKNSNNSYLYWGSGNSLNVNATLNANTSWTFTYSAGTTTLANASDNTRKIKYNSNDTRFAAYTSAQNDISLYKRVSVSANYITTCCQPLAQINGSINLSHF